MAIGPIKPSGFLLRAADRYAYVVKALLIAIYLPEEMGMFICTLDLPCCLRPPYQLGPAQLNPQLPL
jgi:hypothetical protein